MKVLLQVITSDLRTVSTEVSLEEFRVILFKALNFVTDMPPNLLKFSDEVDSLTKQQD